MKKILSISIIIFISLLNAQGITNTLGSNTAADKFIIENSDAETGMVVRGDGNVGIGTSSPVVRLHLKGDKYPNSFMHFESDINNDAGFRFIEDGTTKWHIYNNGASLASQFSIRNNAYEPCLIIDQASGNVGIGTSNPIGKLDINGTIYQRGGQLHADYVFEDDYKLESITEHSAFMWKNKHLKAIPQSMVDENGNEIIEVGSHRKGIVEELEKAHIYISQLEERISYLEELVIKGE